MASNIASRHIYLSTAIAITFTTIAFFVGFISVSYAHGASTSAITTSPASGIERSIHKLSGDTPRSPFAQTDMLEVPDGKILNADLATSSTSKNAGSSKTSSKNSKAITKDSYKLCANPATIDYKKIMKYALKFKGYRYQWGGKFPTTRFDCSGLVTHVYNHVAKAGIDGYMTNAASLYEDYCDPISKSEAVPGDLVFWKGTYNKLDYVSHVGIYCGNNICYAAGNPVGYYKITSVKNIKGKKAKYMFGRFKEGMPYSSADEIVASYGVGYSLIFNHEFFKGTKAYKTNDYGNDASWAFHEFLEKGMKKGWIASPVFDVQYYRSKNPELKKQYGSNYALYYKHFMKSGAGEGLKSSRVFDQEYYKEKYREQTVECNDDIMAYYLDFLSVGIHEGRQGSTAFDPKSYRTAHTDARALFGKNYARYYGHWCTIGRQAGVSGTSTEEVPTARYNKVDYSAVYNYAYYAKRHPDVVKTCGGNYAKVLKHFVLKGMKKGERASATFDVKKYRKYNADLRKRYKKNYKKYYVHYLQKGYKQNRKCA